MSKFQAGQQIRIIDGFRQFHGFATGSIVTTTSNESDDGYISAEGDVNWRDGEVRFASQTLKRQHYELVAPKVDFTKPLQTRDGCSVTLVSTEGRGTYPVLAYIGDKTTIYAFTATGHYYAGSEDDCDIINAPKSLKQEVRYVNLYASQIGNTMHETRAQADAAAASPFNAHLTRIGVRKVVLLEGEFDA